MNAVLGLSMDTGRKSACEALQVPRATFYRTLSQSQEPADIQTQRPLPPLALSQHERQTVLDILHSEQYQDSAPLQVYADLLDQGQYLCSTRTMYRILETAHGDVKERRRQVQRHHYSKPELLATGPNQVWSWDITKLKSLEKWVYFYLYVIIDIFSRYVVGWMIAYKEQDALAKKLIEETCQKQRIQEGQLTIHADRGSSMKSKSVALLLSDLGVIKTHSRPHVSNDNPFSESQFKTLKYNHRFPGKFESIILARSFCRYFFDWYNKEHHHSGIGLVTPEQLHYGAAGQVLEQRKKVLEAAFEVNPKRFKNRMPQPPIIPKTVWINKPKPLDEVEAERRRGVAVTQSPGNEVEATPVLERGAFSGCFGAEEFDRTTLNK